MALYRDHAVVLRTWKLGEADRIVSLHTHDHGKVRGVAKGCVDQVQVRGSARTAEPRHDSALPGQGRPRHDHPGRDRRPFRLAALDPDRFAAHRHCSKRSTRLRKIANPIRNCTSCWSGLAHARSERFAVGRRCVFLKLLDHEGVMPQLEACVSCGEDNPIVAFDPVEGGCCVVTAAGVARSRLRPSRPFVAFSAGAAVCSRTGRSSYGEVDILATLLMEHHLERRLRAVAVLDQTQY